MKFKAIPKWIIYSLVTIAALGFIDATYLTISHYQNSAPPCFIGSCEVVLTSAYSSIAGIPVAVYGVAYYLFILICLIVHIESKREQALAIALFATIAGFVMSLYFFYLQAFVIHAFCQYCLGSATTSTLLFIIAVYVWTKFRICQSEKNSEKSGE